MFTKSNGNQLHFPNNTGVDTKPDFGVDPWASTPSAMTSEGFGGTPSTLPWPSSVSNFNTGGEGQKNVKQNGNGTNNLFTSSMLPTPNPKNPFL